MISDVRLAELTRTPTQDCRETPFPAQSPLVARRELRSATCRKGCPAAIDVQSNTLTFADWFSNAANGGDILTTLPYINTSNGRQNQQVSLYDAAIPLQAGKTVRYLTLPDISDGAVAGTAAMHIFTVAIG